MLYPALFCVSVPVFIRLFLKVRRIFQVQRQRARIFFAQNEVMVAHALAGIGRQRKAEEHRPLHLTSQAGHIRIQKRLTAYFRRTSPQQRKPREHNPREHNPKTDCLLVPSHDHADLFLTLCAGTQTPDKANYPAMPRGVRLE